MSFLKKRRSEVIFSITLTISSIILITFYSCRHDLIYPDDYGYKGPCNCPSDSFPNINHDTLQKPCDPDTVYFQNQILPLILSSCGISGCHDGTDEAKALQSYSTIMNSRYVKAGNAASSKMIEALTNTNPNDKMPPYPYSSLTPEQISLITKWMNQGALNNYCNSCDTTSIHFSSVIWPVIRDNCKGCHSGTTPPKNVALTNYQEVKAITPLVLLGVLKAQGGYAQMPPSGKLSSCKINQISIWINNGAHND